MLPAYIAVTCFTLLYNSSLTVGSCVCLSFELYWAIKLQYLYLDLAWIYSKAHLKNAHVRLHWFNNYTVIYVEISVDIDFAVMISCLLGSWDCLTHWQVWLMHFWLLCLLYMVCMSPSSLYWSISSLEDLVTSQSVSISYFDCIT